MSMHTSVIDFSSLDAPNKPNHPSLHNAVLTNGKRLDLIVINVNRSEPRTARTWASAEWPSQTSLCRAYAGMQPADREQFNPSTSAQALLRAKLRARYGLNGEYVGSSTVALILGLGRTTVHDQIKANRFVIRHRVVNRKPLFLLDDLVAWMIGLPEPGVSAPAAVLEHQAPEVAPGWPVFRHPEAEKAFNKVCESRGIAGPRLRR